MSIPRFPAAFVLVAFAIFQLAFSETSFAQSSSFTYEGRLFSSSGIPLLESVDVKFQILNPAGTCVLYEEVQTGIDLSASKGAFSLGVGSAASDAKRSANFRGAYNPSMISVFRNGSTLSGIPAAGCAAGTYAAGASDSRLLRVQVTKGSTTETLSPDLVINTVPSAQVAASLQGFLPSDFLRLDIANGISGNIGLTASGTGAGQTREFRFYELAANGPEYSAFKAPDAMATSLTYVLPSAAPAAGDILKATVPSSGVVTLSWGADAGAGGGISSFNGSNQSSQSFTAVDIAAAVTAPAWSTNAGTGAHTLQIPMASGAGVTGGLITKTEHTAFSAKVDRTGDTMTGLLNFTGASGVSLANTSGITFTGTGTIAMGTNKITGMADPSAAQEAATKAYVDSQNSGKIGGALTATRIPYASGAATLTDSANFTYTTATGAMTIGGTAPSITSNDAMTIAAGGTNKNVILTPSGTGKTILGGNVGVGTAAPQSPLHIKVGTTSHVTVGTITGGSAFEDYLSMTVDQTAHTATIDSGMYAFAGNPLILNATGGGVGIGKVPVDALDVNGNMSLSGSLRKAGNANSYMNPKETTLNNAIIASDSSTTVLIDTDNNSSTEVFRVMRNGNVENHVNSYEIFRVQENGNVGIGTAAPASKLHVGAAPAASANYGLVSLGSGPFDGATAGYFGTASSASASGTILAANAASGYAGDLINMQIAGASKFRVNSSGVIVSGPSAVAFTDQTGVNLSTTITSNAVTLTGFSGLLPAACTGCIGLLRNGIHEGLSGAFLPGDTIAIQVLSSSSATTAVTASVTIGSTTSATWSVTTGAAASNTPLAFSFQNQIDVNLTSSIISNIVFLSGFTGTTTATCNGGCTDISINGVWAGATSVAGVFSGNQIRIKQTSSSSTSTAATASITVGSTTSSIWSVTTAATSDPCDGSPAIGTFCADGSVYAGLTPDGNVKMFTTPCDLGMTWNGTVCTGVRVYRFWNDGSTNWGTTGLTSTSTGKFNTDTLVALGTSPSPAPYGAARQCGTNAVLGHGDWYLPAKDELNVLYTNRVAVGNFDTTGIYYNTSTEYSATNAWMQRFSDGALYGFNHKATSTVLVRCVRK